MADLSKRVAKLEEASRPNGGVIVIFMRFGETEQAAKARWLARHPGRSLTEASLTVYIVRWSGEGEEEPWPGAGGQPVVDPKLLGLARCARRTPLTESCSQMPDPLSPMSLL